MADVNFPQMSQLSQIEFMSPALAQQAMGQLDLAKQFSQQNLAQGEQDLQTKTLNNLFQVQNDPLKLQKSQLEIEGTTADNVIKKIEAAQRATLAPEELEAKRAKLVKEWSDSKLEKAMNDAQEMMWSDDPKLQEKGKSLYANSFKEISARAKAKDEMAKQESENASRERIAAGNNAATLGAARISADARSEAARLKAQGGGAASIWNAIQMGKMTPEKAAISAFAMAQIEQDPEEAQRLMTIAQTAERMVMNKAQAGADARQAGQLDLEAYSKGKLPTKGSQLTPAIQPTAPRGVSGPVGVAPEAGVSGSFDLGPNNERLNQTIRAIQSIKDPQERANAATALQNQLNGGNRAPAPQPAAPAASGLPKAGEVRKGYRFKGGDPSKRENWEKV